MSLWWGRAVLARLRVPVSDRVVVPTLVLACALVAWLAVGGSMSETVASATVPNSVDEEAPAITISEARLCQLPARSDTLPGPECAWKTVPLAKMWSGHRGGQPQVDAWFKLDFRLDAVPARGLAMYVVAFNRTGRLFVNGHYVRQFGSMTEPLPLNWNRSQYAFMPAGLLHAGANEIEIQQRAYGWEWAWLAPVQLGSESKMQSMWRLRVFWQNELVRILGVSTATIGLFLLGVWLGRRSHAMYFWFGCVSLLWALISLDYFALYPPLPAHLWENCMETAQVLRGVLMFMFTLRYCGKRWPLVELCAWVYLVLGSAAMFSNLLPSYAIDLWYLGTLLGSVVYFVMLVRQGLRVSLLEGSMLAVAGATQIGLSGYDLWLYSSMTWTDRVYLTHFSAPLFVGVVGTILILRFVESLNAVRAAGGRAGAARQREGRGAGAQLRAAAGGAPQPGAGVSSAAAS